MDDVIIEPKFGRVEIDSWLQPVGDKLIGMCRRREYDRYGVLMLVSEPVETGISIRIGEEPKAGDTFMAKLLRALGMSA